MKKIGELIKRFWHDPVGSKVIGAIIFSILSALFVKLYAIFKHVNFKQASKEIFKYLISTTPIWNFLWILFLVVLFILILKLRKNGNNETKSKDENLVEDDEDIGEIPIVLPTMGGITTSFFENRICDAFPTTRGLIILTNPKTIHDRLDIFFRDPIEFDTDKSENRSDPIWFFRGTSSMHIDSYSRISNTKSLLKYYEAKISKLAVYHPSSYYKCFLYCELKPEKSVNVDKYTKDDISNAIENNGYARQEYAILNNRYYTRQEYDDGSAVRNGKVKDISGAKLMVRLLSKYNFILAAPDSPMNSRRFDRLSDPLYNRLLTGKSDIQELVDLVDSLNKRED